jgi:lipoprotein NlpD
MKRFLAVLFLTGCASQHGPAPVVDGRGVGATAKPAPVAAPAARTAAPAVADGQYLVKKGDTLYSIALEHGADYRELAQWNGLDDPTRIRVGQLLQVRPPEPAAGAPVVGRIGSRGVESHALDTPQPLAKPLPPVAVAPAVATAPAALPPVAKDPAGSEFIWPAKGKILARFAEPRSKGIDIDGKPGEPIVAAAAGRVTYTGSGIPGLGKLVVIRHDNGFITVYAHNRDILVKEQQTVSRGQKIAELGSSDSDRPKLHFQIRKGSAAVDPLRYLPAL